MAQCQGTQRSPAQIADLTTVARDLVAHGGTLEEVWRMLRAAGCAT